MGRRGGCGAARRGSPSGGRSIARSPRGVLELLAGPEDRPLGAGVEALGVEHGALVVVAQEADAQFLDHQVEALARVGPVADDVAQAEDFVDALAGDVGKHCLECFQVAVDVADDRPLHRRRLASACIEVNSQRGAIASGC